MPMEPSPPSVGCPLGCLSACFSALACVQAQLSWAGRPLAPGQPPRKTGRSPPLPWRLLPSVLSLARHLGEARAQGQDSSASAAYRLFDRRPQASSIPIYHFFPPPDASVFSVSHPIWRFITRPLSRQLLHSCHLWAPTLAAASNPSPSPVNTRPCPLRRSLFPTLFFLVS